MPEYATPEEIERAFYQAFESADLDAMMGLWAAHEPVSCVHPMGKILHGWNEVREGWRQLFTGDQRMHFEIQTRHRSVDSGLAVHVVIESIYLHGDTRPRPPVIATNVYKRTDTGWRMILHHASPSVIDPARRDAEPTPAAALH